MSKKDEIYDTLDKSKNGLLTKFLHHLKEIVTLKRLGQPIYNKFTNMYEYELSIPNEFINLFGSHDSRLMEIGRPDINKRRKLGDSEQLIQKLNNDFIALYSKINSEVNLVDDLKQKMFIEIITLNQENPLIITIEATYDNVLSGGKKKSTKNRRPIKKRRRPTKRRRHKKRISTKRRR